MFTISMTSSETVQIVSVHNVPEEEDGRGGGGEQLPCLLRVEEDETVILPLLMKPKIIQYKICYLGFQIVFLMFVTHYSFNIFLCKIQKTGIATIDSVNSSPMYINGNISFTTGTVV